MLKLMMFGVVVVGLGIAAVTVPIEGKTAFARAREIHWGTLADKGAALATKAKDAVQHELGDDPKPAEKTAPPKIAAAQPVHDKAPAEQITKSDREALDRLVPR